MQRGQFVGVSWVDEMITKLMAELSSERHSRSGEMSPLEHDDRIGSAKVAAMTGWHIRKVQRDRKKLGGEKIGNSIVFRESAVREHLEGAA